MSGKLRGTKNFIEVVKEYMVKGVQTFEAKKFRMTTISHALPPPPLIHGNEWVANNFIDGIEEYKKPKIFKI